MKKIRTSYNRGGASTASSRRYLIVILGVHFILAGIYWAYTPFGAPPDEGAHSKYVETLLAERTLPVFRHLDRENYENHQPPLYYVLAVPFYWLGNAYDSENPGEFIRLLSIVLGAASIFVLYRAVTTALPSHPELAVSSSAFAALLPTHIMLSSSVSNDILMELVFGIALFVLFKILLGGVTWRKTFGLGIALGVGLLTKGTCILLFPVTLATFFLVWRRRAPIRRQVLAHCAVALVVGLAIGGWWLVRNHVLYGDPLAASLFKSAFQHTATPEFWLSRGWTYTGYFALVAMWTFASFWGVFGHMNVFMPWPMYAVLALCSMVAITGVISVVRKTGLEFVADRDVLVIFLVTICLVLVAFVQFNLSFFQAQGRYLYPALIPISALWSLGIWGALPAKLKPSSAFVSAGIALTVQLVALFTCIIPRLPHYG